MNHTVALPGSMIWMGIRLSSGSRPQSPKGPSTALTQSVFCSYGPIVIEWPEMLCAWSSQYPHRPIPPDQSRSVYRSRSQMVLRGLSALLAPTLTHRIASHLDAMGVMYEPVEDAGGQ